MESKILGFGLRNTTLGIRRPLTIGIRNPVAGVRNPLVWNLEYKTVLDSLTWGDPCIIKRKSYEN